MIFRVLLKPVQGLVFTNGTVVLATAINNLFLAIDPLADRQLTSSTVCRRTGAGTHASSISLSDGSTWYSDRQRRGNLPDGILKCI